MDQSRETNYNQPSFLAEEKIQKDTISIHKTRSRFHTNEHVNKK